MAGADHGTGAAGDGAAAVTDTAVARSPLRPLPARRLSTSAASRSAMRTASSSELGPAGSASVVRRGRRRARFVGSGPPELECAARCFLGDPPEYIGTRRRKTDRPGPDKRVEGVNSPRGRDRPSTASRSSRFSTFIAPDSGSGSVRISTDFGTL